MNIRTITSNICSFLFTGPNNYTHTMGWTKLQQSHIICFKSPT